MASPQVIAAAASTRRPEDVLEARRTASQPISMTDVIRIGAEQAVAAERGARCVCPFCGEDPPLASLIAGKFIVGCENEDCAANPQVSAPTCAEAWARWNRRSA